MFSVMAAVTSLRNRSLMSMNSSVMRLSVSSSRRKTSIAGPTLPLGRS